MKSNEELLNKHGFPNMLDFILPEQEKKRVVFIAHPIGGDVEGNLVEVCKIIRSIHLYEEGVAPFAPYVADLMSLHDSIEYEREKGINNSLYFIDKSYIDELRLYGDDITPGMHREIVKAISRDVMVVPMTRGTKAAFAKEYGEIVEETEMI